MPRPDVKIEAIFPVASLSLINNAGKDMNLVTSSDKGPSYARDV